MISPDIIALDRLLQPHLETARQRDPHLGMIMMEDMPDSPLSSSDDELEYESTEMRMPHGGASKRGHHDSVRQKPKVQLPAPNSTDRDRKRRIVFAEADDDDYNFEYEEVVSAEPAPSGLTALLTTTGGGSSGGGGAQGAGASPVDAGPPVKIKVWGAPVSGGCIELEVTKATTFVQVIARVLARASRSPGNGGAPMSSTGVYEILMADDDGDADEDFPPPARDQQICDFGTLFRMRPLAKALAEEASAPAASESAPAAASGMRVLLPREAFGQRLEQWYVTQPYKEEAMLKDLMRQVCERPAVRLHPAKYVFTLPGEGKPLNMGAKLGQIELPRNDGGVPEIAVAPRAYADAPPPLKRAMGASTKSLEKEEPGSAAAAAEPKENTRNIDFVFSDVTAAQYKEYQVTKVNKRGVRQQRVLGIDRERFYNLAHSREEAGPSSFRDWGLKTIGLRQVEGGTKHPFRPMRDALDAQIVDSQPSAFEVIFKDVNEGAKGRKTQRYEAETAREAAEIVAKLTYLMNNMGGTRTQRLQESDDAPTFAPGRVGFNSIAINPTRRLSG